MSWVLGHAAETGRCEKHVSQSRYHRPGVQLYRSSTDALVVSEPVRLGELVNAAVPVADFLFAYNVDLRYI